MALPKLFQRIFWHNNTTPAINEDNLNAMSKAIDDLDNRVIVLGDDVITVIPQIQAYLDQAEDLVEAMELLSENPPYIGQNGNWWVWDTNTSAFVDSGVDASISVDIADITMLAPNADPYVINSGTDTDPIFHLYIPRGQTGNGISTIAKTGTSGLVDTYTITMTDGTTSTFTVTNGAGDMNKSVYDPTNAIANAGGMKSAAAKNSTNAVTENSTDLVESGAVYAKTEPLWDNMMDNGAVNLLPNYGTTQTISPVTFTVNADKTVTASASQAASSVCNFNITWASKNYKLKPGTYKLTGCPSGGKVPSGSNDTYAIECYNATRNSRIGWEIGNGFEFTLAEESIINIIISIRNGYNIDGSLVFKPMISDPSLNLSYDDYVPYAMTNKELTDGISSIESNISDIPTIRNNAANAYSGILKLAERDIGNNANVTIPNMVGVWIAIMSRTQATSCGLYLLVIHSNGSSNAILPIAPVANTDFSISVSGTSVIVQTGTATSGRIRFLRLSNANY